MPKGVRWSIDQLDEFRRRQHREDMRHPRPEPATKVYGYVGDANENEIPTLPVTDAVAGPGARRKPSKPRKTKKPEERPYYQQLTALLPYGIPEPRCEYPFSPPRKWRWDFCWPSQMLALEIDGGLFINGSHSRGAAVLRQMEKQNAGTLLGWRILRYSPAQLVQAARDVAKVFGR